MEHKVGLRDYMLYRMELTENGFRMVRKPAVEGERYDACMKEVEFLQRLDADNRGTIEALEDGLAKERAAHKLSAHMATKLAKDKAQLQSEVERLDKLRQHNLNEWSKAFNQVNELEQKLREIREAVTCPCSFGVLHEIREVLDR